MFVPKNEIAESGSKFHMKKILLQDDIHAKVWKYISWVYLFNNFITKIYHTRYLFRNHSNDKIHPFTAFLVYYLILCVVTLLLQNKRHSLEYLIINHKIVMILKQKVLQKWTYMCNNALVSFFLVDIGRIIKEKIIASRNCNLKFVFLGIL